MDKTNKGMQIKIDVDAKKTIQIVESKPYQIREKSQNSSIESYGIEGDILDIDFPMDLNNTNKNLTGRIYKIQKVEVSRFFYWEITKPDKIIIKEEVLKPNDGYILSENGKQGYFSSGYNKLIVPVQFDEVLKAEFTGHNGGYILRNGNKYGLFIYDFKLPNSRIIDPVFDKIPLLVNYDYFKEKDPLIKLYDKAGYFYCYANGDGILYCSEK